MERQGKAISLFSADELAYVADLFLFLGRPLKFATLDSVHSGIIFIFCSLNNS